jgi:hypothetical protein
MTVGVMSVGEITVGVMTVGVMSVGEITVGVMTVGVMSVGEITVGVMTAGVMRRPRQANALDKSIRIAATNLFSSKAFNQSSIIFNKVV